MACASSGETARAGGLLEQALAIGRQIEDPEIVREASEVLERLRQPARSPGEPEA